jgi:hypothetical protein
VKPRSSSSSSEDDDDDDDDDESSSEAGAALPPPPPVAVLLLPLVPPPPPAGAGAAPEQARFKGVSRTPNGRWCARTCVDAHTRRHGGVHDTQEAAARAYDDAVRRHGILLVNFPRPGTAETQAAPGKRYSKKDQEVPSSPEKKKARVAAPAAAPAQAGAPAAPAAAALAAPLPSLAQAAQAPHAAAAAAMAAASNDAEEDIASFLRAIVPPLSCLAATLAALPRSGMRMAHLAMVTPSCAAAAAQAEEDHRNALFKEAAAELCNQTPADRLALKSALMRRAARADGAGGSGAAA